VQAWTKLGLVTVDEMVEYETALHRLIILPARIVPPTHTNNNNHNHNHTEEDDYYDMVALPSINNNNNNINYMQIVKLYRKLLLFVTSTSITSTSSTDHPSSAMRPTQPSLDNNNNNNNRSFFDFFVGFSSSTSNNNNNNNNNTTSNTTSSPTSISQYQWQYSVWQEDIQEYVLVLQLLLIMNKLIYQTHLRSTHTTTTTVLRTGNYREMIRSLPVGTRSDLANSLLEQYAQWQERLWRVRYHNNHRMMDALRISALAAVRYNHNNNNKNKKKTINNNNNNNSDVATINKEAIYGRELYDYYLHHNYLVQSDIQLPALALLQALCDGLPAPEAVHDFLSRIFSVTTTTTTTNKKK
jgi:hypothetical protein